MQEKAGSSAALALAGSVGMQATMGGSTWDSPIGPIQTGLAAGLGGMFLATRIKKKKTRHRLFFASLGAACGQAAIQTYKMEIDVFGLNSNTPAATDEAA